MTESRDTLLLREAKEADRSSREPFDHLSRRHPFASLGCDCGRVADL